RLFAGSGKRSDSRGVASGPDPRQCRNAGETADHLNRHRTGKRSGRRRDVRRIRIGRSRPGPRLQPGTHDCEDRDAGAFLMSATPPQAQAGTAPRDAGATLPAWARNLAESYESNASSQFIIFGNISDRMVLEGAPPPRLGSLADF